MYNEKIANVMVKLEEVINSREDYKALLFLSREIDVLIKEMKMCSK